eukprot:TRINITY_DN6343_c0_g1_i4.p1 TRINITY_DN6343_c0_g1~~TRINITY_DN6343_c0_g1_i4.p1  ORF type:complete len:147 (-),score=0.78 TRINITY_DN6343_c0_g1_i4:531-971(-)
MRCSMRAHSPKVRARNASTPSAACVPRPSAIAPSRNEEKASAASARCGAGAVGTTARGEGAARAHGSWRVGRYSGDRERGRGAAAARFGDARAPRGVCNALSGEKDGGKERCHSTGFFCRPGAPPGHHRRSKEGLCWHGSSNPSLA